MTKPADLDCVALRRDLPEFGLRAGDAGVVVLVYPEGAVEVEFVDRNGYTVGFLTIDDDDLDVVPNSEAVCHPEPRPDGEEEFFGDVTRNAKQPQRYSAGLITSPQHDEKL